MLPGSDETAGQTSARRLVAPVQPSTMSVPVTFSATNAAGSAAQVALVSITTSTQPDHAKNKVSGAGANRCPLGAPRDPEDREDTTSKNW
jgi:hypothetical protein